MNKDPEGYGKDFEFLFSFLPPLHLGLKWYISLTDVGFVTVPITVIASTKKVKSLVSNINMLTQAIRSSSKLVSILDAMRHYFWSLLVCSLTTHILKVLSVDGKKVKRKHPYTEKEKEDLLVKKLDGFFFFLFCPHG